MKGAMKIEDVRPGVGRVLLKDAPEERSAGGITIAGTNRNGTSRGVVVAVGAVGEGQAVGKMYTGDIAYYRTADIDTITCGDGKAVVVPILNVYATVAGAAA